MNIFYKITVVAYLLFSLLTFGCNDPKGAAFVYGNAGINPGGGDDHINGELAKSSSSDYYGYCEKTSSGFNFVVAHANVNDLDDVTSVDQPLYFKFEGVKGAGKNGAPTDGVFDGYGDYGKGLPKYGDKYEGSFKSAKIIADETFIFGPSDGNCSVELFATPTDGEVLTNTSQDHYIENKSFEYYVRIDCNGMQNVISSESGLPLNSMYLEFYFDNC